MRSDAECFVFSIVDSLPTFPALIVPGCDDVIDHVTQHTDDKYRNSTRYFISASVGAAVQPLPPIYLSRDDDIMESRVTPNDVMTPTTFKLVLVCLDIVVSLYRATHIARVVKRMRNCRSRDHNNRKYYYDDGDSERRSRSRTRQNETATRGELHDVDDETEYQLTSTSSSHTSSYCVESSALCRLVRSSNISKLVLFAALVTSCQVVLQMIDRSQQQVPVGIDHVTVAASQSAIAGLDFDMVSLYGTQRHDVMKSFNSFVVNYLSHLNVMLQLTNDGNLIILSLSLSFHSCRIRPSFLAECCNRQQNPGSLSCVVYFPFPVFCLLL